MQAAIRSVLILVLLVVASVSCSDGTGSKGGKASSPTPTAAGSVAAGSGSGANPLSSVVATPSDVDLARPCDPILYQSGNTGQPGGDYIRAHPRVPASWGADCEILNPGDKCHVTWEGSYVVMVGEQAHLQFQAWSKGVSKPIKVLDLGPLPPENRIRRIGFPVTIPSGTEVAFRLILMNAAKAPVAISDAFAYKLNCRKGPG